MSINIPNVLTISRIILIPIFVGVFYFPIHWLDVQQQNLVATIIFAVAGITDWFDGWLARKLNQTSALGAFLDPVADKLMVCAGLAVLLKLGRVDSFAAIIIISREISISALREWMAKLGADNSVAVSFVGKLKTTAQMIAIPILLYSGEGLFLVVGSAVLNIAAILTIVSMGYYLKKAWPEIKAKTVQFDAKARIADKLRVGVVKA
jgi:cardiolipin synthase